MHKVQIDETDKLILKALLNNSRKPFLEVARECGISGPAIHQRIKKMENSGIICGSQLVITHQSLGLSVCAFINITLSENNKYWEVVKELKKIPEIVECHFVTGNSTILIKLYCKDNEHLMQVIIHQLNKIPFVQATKTMLSLDKSFERTILLQD